MQQYIHLSALTLLDIIQSMMNSSSDNYYGVFTKPCAPYIY